MNSKFAAAALLVALITSPIAALAHHSFAMFDHSKEVELKGTVVSWEWTSPHTWIYLLVPNGTKTPTKYSIEGANPGALRRDGFGKGTMSPGDKVTVYMAPLKSGDKGGSLNAVVLANGKMMGQRMETTQ